MINEVRISMDHLYIETADQASFTAVRSNARDSSPKDRTIPRRLLNKKYAPPREQPRVQISLMATCISLSTSGTITVISGGKPTMTLYTL